MARGLERSRIPHRSAHGNRWSILKIEAAEDPDGIERLKRGCGLRVGQRRGKIKTFNGGLVIGRIQVNDFGILRRGRRHQVAVGGNKVRQPHAWLIRVTSSTHDMALQVNGLLVERGDREDMYLVAVSNVKGRELGFDVSRISRS